MTLFKKSAIERVMTRRPITLAAAAYACGAAVQASFAARPAISAALLFAALLALALFRHRVFAFSAVIFIGALLTALAMRMPEGETLRGVQVEARVVSVKGEGDVHESFVLDRATLGKDAYPYKIDAYAYGGVQIAPGDVVSFTATLYPPSRARNPGEADEAMMLWKDGIALRASVSADSLTSLGGRLSLMNAFVYMRRALGDRIDALFPQSAPLVKALTIGVRDALPRELKDDFRTMGVAHLLAISGLHIECLALMADFLLSRARVPRRVSFFLIAAFFFVYVCLIGLSPSAIRAAIMFIMLRASPLMGRPADGLSRLSVAFLLLVLVKPLSVFDYGFVLSFSAVAGLMLLMPIYNRFVERRRQRNRAVRYLASLVVVSAVAQLSTLPAIACYYGQISPWSLIANLAAVPVSMAVLPLSMLAIAASYVFFELGALVAAAPDALLHALSMLLSKMTALPFTTLALPAWPGWLQALYACAIVLLSRLSDVPVSVKRAAAVGVPLLIAISFIVRAAALPGGFTVVFLDAGNADASVVFAEGTVYLMDAGDSDSPAAEYLSHLGIGEIQGVFLTHPHKDHAAGLSRVLDQARVKVLYLPEGFFSVDRDESVDKVLKKAEEKGAKVEMIAEGDVLELSRGVTLYAHQAGTSARSDPDDVSLVAHIKYGSGSVLFLADMPRETEKLPMPDADVLKVAHHGSAYNTSELLVKYVSPSMAVIPVGYNSYGHPSGEVLHRLRRAGAEIYRTDECGAVTVRIFGDGTVRAETYIEMEKQGA